MGIGWDANNAVSSTGPVVTQVIGTVPLRALVWSHGIHTSLADPQQPVYVLLHGLGDGADIWRGVVEHWSQPRGTIVAIDLPGHGGSGRLEPPYRRTDIADCVGVALRALGIATPVLIGHSLGGQIALLLAAGSNVSVAGTVLVDVGVRSKPELDRILVEHIDRLIEGALSIGDFARSIKQHLPLADLDVLNVILADLCAARGSRHEYAVPLDANIKTLLNAGDTLDMGTLLQRIRCPCGVIRGEISSVLPEKDLAWIAARTGSFTRTEVVRLAGHALLIEKPDRVAQAIERLVLPWTRGG
ncbi:alpha/beta fold hydrolase [Consotaella aegiceratis]|uniref:alpha/beta fold hydrolase n=1 Tax=Consotaella aegiceratis TaxID=3097961 RepID=UPI002F3FD81E